MLFIYYLLIFINAPNLLRLNQLTRTVRVITVLVEIVHRIRFSLHLGTVRLSTDQLILSLYFPLYLFISGYNLPLYDCERSNPESNSLLWLPRSERLMLPDADAATKMVDEVLPTNRKKNDSSGQCASSLYSRLVIAIGMRWWSNLKIILVWDIVWVFLW